MPKRGTFKGGRSWGGQNNNSQRFNTGNKYNGMIFFYRFPHITLQPF